MMTTAPRQSITAPRDSVWMDRDIAARLSAVPAAVTGAQQSECLAVDPDSLPGRGRWGLD